MCGIDLNLLELVNDSDGSAFENRRFREDAEHAIMKQQRALSRKVEAAKREGRTLAASRNYQKQRIKLAKTHRLIARQRQDYLNVISKHIQFGRLIQMVRDVFPVLFPLPYALGQEIFNLSVD